MGGLAVSPPPPSPLLSSARGLVTPAATKATGFLSEASFDETAGGGRPRRDDALPPPPWLMVLAFPGGLEPLFMGYEPPGFIDDMFPAPVFIDDVKFPGPAFIDDMKFPAPAFIDDMEFLAPIFIDDMWL